MNKLRTEPVAVLTATLIAVQGFIGNLTELTTVAAAVVTAVLGVIVRSKVTPTASILPLDVELFLNGDGVNDDHTDFVIARLAAAAARR